MGIWSTIGAIAGGAFGMPMFGSAIGSAFDSSEDRRRVRAQQNRNVAEQERFARSGIQWRVEDAKRAGVHPLFALGGGGAAFSPNPVSVSGGDDGSSQNINRAFEVNLGRDQQALLQAQTRAAEASAAENLAQAQYWSSEVARRAQQAGPGAPEGLVLNAYRDVGSPTVHPLESDAIRLTPDDVVSRNSSFPAQTAGRDQPSFREFLMPNGDRVLLPATQGGGIPEDIDVSILLETLGANISRYGARSVPDAIARWMGISPEARRGRTLESLARELIRRAKVVPYRSPWERR